ncbi:MAG: hypothetical protein NVSMB65_19620 [Chloroflexota bacterium]
MRLAPRFQGGGAPPASVEGFAGGIAEHCAYCALPAAAVFDGVLVCLEHGRMLTRASRARGER